MISSLSPLSTDDLLADLDYPLSFLFEALLNSSLQLVIAFLFVATLNITSIIVLKILYFIIFFLHN